MSERLQLQSAKQSFGSYVVGFLASQAHNGLHDGDIRLPVEVSRGEVLNEFLAAHPQFSRFRNDLARMFRSLMAFGLDRDLWEKRVRP
jgi:hypothetical protein